MHPPLLLEPTAMVAVKLLCAPRLEYYMVLGPVLGQRTQVLTLPTPWRCLWRNKLRQYIDDVKGDVPAVENEIACADITGDLKTLPVNARNPVSLPSEPRESSRGSLLAAFFLH
ncbi:hypothetical protein J6590_086884 [Homalodisca vitripennis]|nr:hypothetical protein J6590_086884 [Homalodisca vitripennis]